MATSLSLFNLLFAFLMIIAQSWAAPPLCPRSAPAFVDSLRLQCPVWIERSSAVEVSGDTLDNELARGQASVHYAILFYASWCPFSRDIRPTFEALSSMFPQMSHLAVEESSTMPSVFSRYGVRSFPSILLANQTTMVRYRGPKNLRSLVGFYKETTGLDPIAYLDVNQVSRSVNSRSLRPWDGSSREIIANEPYLAFCLLFIYVKAILHFYPKIIACLKVFWISYARHLRLGIFSELTQLLERALHLIDVKKLWDKIKLCNKSRNFQNGAKNARVWASSLASVSLGESSSRLAPSVS